MMKPVCKEGMNTFISLTHDMFRGSSVYNSLLENSRRGLTSIMKAFVLDYYGPDVCEWGQYVAFRLLFNL